MAAVDRRNSNVDDFLGLNLSCWTAASDEDISKYGSETMTLRKGDMHIFGHCPANDDFFLVVCSQVVKPQAFEEHCEWRHGSFTKARGPSSTLAPQHRPHPGGPPTNLSSSRARQKNGRCKAGNAAALPVHQDTPLKSQEAVSLHSAAPPTPLLIHPLPQASYMALRDPASRPLFLLQSSVHMGTENLQSDSQKLRQERKQPQQTLWRSECRKEEDVQPSTYMQSAEITRKKYSSVSKGAGDSPSRSGCGTASCQSKRQRATFGRKSNCQGLRDPSQSFQEENDDSTVDLEVQPPYPFNQKLLSSGESDDDEQVTTHLPTSPCHPKPLGLYNFGCRILGCSIFTFDRRWHHLRFALGDMMEHHVNM